MSEDLASAWEAAAGDWAAWARTPGHDRHFEVFNLPAMLALLPTPGALTVDVGCGEGRVGAALAALGHRLIGIDSSPTLAALAEEREVYDEVHVASAAAMPLHAATADLVVCNMVLMDVDDLEGVVEDCARILAPGGRFVGSVVHPYSDMLARRGAGQSEEYFASWRYADAIERDGLAITFHSFHHSLERYVGALTDAGLLLEGLREPRPSAAAAAADPLLAPWRQRPNFLHLRAVKTG